MTTAQKGTMTTTRRTTGTTEPVRPPRTGPLDLDGQWQDDAGALVGQPRRQGDPAALQTLGGAWGDRAHGRPELVQRLGADDGAGGGQQPGQLRAGVHRLAELGCDPQVADRGQMQFSQDARGLQDRS